MSETTTALDRARAALRDGDREAAISAFRKALEESPGDPISLFGLGTTLLELRRDEDAESVLQEAHAAASQNPDIRNRRGVALRRLKKYPEAIPHLTAAAAAYPDRPGVLVNLANALRADHRLDQAEPMYR